MVVKSKKTANKKTCVLYENTGFFFDNKKTCVLYDTETQVIFFLFVVDHKRLKNLSKFWLNTNFSSKLQTQGFFLKTKSLFF